MLWFSPCISRRAYIVRGLYRVFHSGRYNFDKKAW